MSKHKYLNCLRVLCGSLRLTPENDGKLTVIPGTALHCILEINLASMCDWKYDEQVVGNWISRKLGIKGFRDDCNIHLFYISSNNTMGF